MCGSQTARLLHILEHMSLTNELERRWYIGVFNGFYTLNLFVLLKYLMTDY